MTRAGFRSLSLSFLAALSLALFACGGSSGDGDGDGDGDIGDPCEDAINCNGTAICDPTDNTCQDDVDCTDHAQCGKGGNCNLASGKCEVSTTGSPCESDTQCQRGEACVASDNVTGGFCGCDGEEFEPMPVTPNMLVLLDRSGSMDNDSGNGMTKYEVALDAINTLMGDFDGLIRFGLSMYPSVGNETACTGGQAGGQIDVDIGDNQGSAILNILGMTNPGGNTPLETTLQDTVTGYAGLLDPTRPNYVLAINDGQPNCAKSGEDGDPVDEVAALFNNDNIKTFVVGFGAGVNPTVLNNMAQAGGTARMMGGDDYYQADNAAELDQAFQTIGGQVLSCSFQLEADPDAIIRAFFDGAEQTGFTFDPDNGVITFDDPAVCDELQGGNVEELVIVNSCPIDTQ